MCTPPSRTYQSIYGDPLVTVTPEPWKPLTTAELFIWWPTPSQANTLLSESLFMNSLVITPSRKCLGNSSPNS